MLDVVFVFSMILKVLEVGNILLLLTILWSPLFIIGFGIVGIGRFGRRILNIRIVFVYTFVAVFAVTIISKKSGISLNLLVTVGA